MAILETRTTWWADEEACATSARALAQRSVLRRAIVELTGPLGAGKTSFVRYLLRALGVSGRIKSPSYAIVEPYEPPGLPVWHFDFYRFTDVREWDDAGLRDLYATPGLKLVEWPEQARSVLPAPDLRIVIDAHPDESRRVQFEALSPLGQELLP